MSLGKDLKKKDNEKMKPKFWHWLCEPPFLKKAFQSLINIYFPQSHCRKGQHSGNAGHSQRVTLWWLVQRNELGVREWISLDSVLKSGRAESPLKKKKKK